MLLEYTLHTILILPSAAALLLAICVLSLQLFVVPLHFLPDAIVTRLRRSPASCDCSLLTECLHVKSYDYVIVGGTLASHMRFVNLKKQHPEASILLLEPPLDLKSLIFTFFAGLDIGVRHTVPYFRAYPFYRALHQHHVMMIGDQESVDATAEQQQPIEAYVKYAISTFALLIDELARDLAADNGVAQNNKLPRYRIVERIEPTSYSIALANRHMFPIHYADLRASSECVKILLGVESVVHLGTTKDQRIAIQVNIQNQDDPFILYVNRQLQLYDTVNARTRQAQPLEQVIRQEGFEKYALANEDDEAYKVHRPEILVQRFVAVQRKSSGEDNDGCFLWTLTEVDHENGRSFATDTTGRVVEILVGFDDGTDTAFETATSFAVGPFEDKARGEEGLWIEQTIYGARHEHLAQWGHEMIQRVWDSLKDGTFIDSHSDVQSTTTINSSSPENGARSPLLSPVDTSHYHHHHQLAISSPMTDIRYAEYLQPRATIYQPGARHFVMLSSTIPRSVSADGLPSYLAKIWTLVFEDTNSISAQEANAKNIDRSHPITTRFATMLKSTVPAMSGQQQDDAELKIHHSPSSYSHAVLSQSIPFNEDENNKTMEQSVDSDASDCTGQSSLSSYLFSDEEEPLDLSSESAEEATVMMTYEDQDQSSNSNHYVSDTEEYYSDVTPSENPPMDDEDEDEHEDALIAVLQQTHKHQEQQQLLLHPFSSQENKCSSVISENDIDDEEGTDLTAQNMDDVASALLDSVLDENPVDYRHSDESKNIEMQGGNYDQPGDSIVKYVDGRSSSHSPEVEERAAAAEPIHLQEQDDVTVALEEDESPGTAEEPQTEVPATTKKKKKSKKTKRRGV